MKIQTTAIVSSICIDSKELPGVGERSINLEFSAIDTGGGFKDPILDFSFALPTSALDAQQIGEEKTIAITLQDPEKGSPHKIGFTHDVMNEESDSQSLEINGRLKDDALSEELIGFVFRLLRSS